MVVDFRLGRYHLLSEIPASDTSTAGKILVAPPRREALLDTHGTSTAPHHLTPLSAALEFPPGKRAKTEPGIMPHTGEDRSGLPPKTEGRLPAPPGLSGGFSSSTDSVAVSMQAFEHSLSKALADHGDSWAQILRPLAPHKGPKPPP